jgi:hypothetical protein
MYYFEEVAEGEVGSGLPAPLPPVEEEEDGSPTKKKAKRKKKEEPEEEELHQSADPAAGLPQVHGQGRTQGGCTGCTCILPRHVHPPPPQPERLVTRKDEAVGNKKKMLVCLPKHNYKLDNNLLTVEPRAVDPRSRIRIQLKILMRIRIRIWIQIWGGE